MDIAFTGGTIVTVNESREILFDAGLLVEGDKIINIGSAQDIRRKALEKKIAVQDFSGKVMFPGLINTHTHLFQNLLKGIGSGYRMEDWWSKTIGYYGAFIEEQDFRNAACAGLLEAAKSGTTTILDYSYANPIPYVGDAIIESATKVGIRLIYGRGFNVSNEFVPKALREPLEKVFTDTLRLREQYKEIDIWLAPAVNWSMTRDELIRMNQFARDEKFPITMHLLETASDEEIWQDLYQKNLMRDLSDIGILDKSFLGVHFVSATDKDIHFLKKHGASVSHNPISNMYLASGVCPLPELLEQGIPVSLGTDGAASNNTLDMLETMKMTALLQKVHRKDPQCIDAMQVLEMATIQGAKALKKDHEIGSLEVGKQADLFLMEPTASLKSSPMHDPLATLIYSSSEDAISHVMVAGKFVICNHISARVNTEETIQSLNKSARKLIENSGGYHD